MKYGYLSLIATVSLGACVAPTSSTENESTVLSASSGSTCAKPTAQDDVQRAAATAAFSLMKLSADLVNPNDKRTSSYGTLLTNVQSTSILASQQYRIRSTGTGIEFDPTDPLDTYVSGQMRSTLAFVQMDTAVAKFLSDALTAAYAKDDGHLYPHILALPALAGFSFKGSATTHIRDGASTDDSHYATVTSQASCGNLIVNIAETVDKDWMFAPLDFSTVNMWRSSPPSYFHGKGTGATSPFNGSGGNNPHLIVSIDGQATAFAAVPWTNCWNNSGFRCTSTIQVDPVPYFEPGDFSNSNGVQGTQANPFVIVGNSLFADPYHAYGWATRTLNGVQEWGTFSRPIQMGGYTRYLYIKQM